jgi:hypothetical protein
LSEINTETPRCARARLSFNIKTVDALLPGFALGDFAVLHGSLSALTLSMLLCVRAQLPLEEGGLGTNVIFIDGGNSFRLYDASRIAQLYGLDAREALERIFISRAFTAYQMTYLIFKRLERAADEFNTKLVVVSDLPRLYLDEDVPEREAEKVFNQLTLYLSEFIKEKGILAVVTHLLPAPSNIRSVLLKEMLCEQADVVASIKPSAYTKRGVRLQEFILEKHHLHELGGTAFSESFLNSSVSAEAETWGRL